MLSEEEIMFFANQYNLVGDKEAIIAYTTAIIDNKDQEIARLHEIIKDQRDMLREK